MNLKAFFVDALSTALDTGIATSDDVLRHVGPDVLAECLPRPLWARLLTACLGASKVDAQLVIETIGVPNLCEHVPTELIWSVIAEVALRSLGRELVAATPKTPTPAIMTRSAPLAMTPPPAEKPREPIAAKPAAIGPSIPTNIPSSSGSGPTQVPAQSPVDSLADVVAALENDERSSMPSRARTPTSQRFRQSNTGIGRLAANNSRRPQAPVEPPVPGPAGAPPPGRQQRRGSTEVTDYEIETEVGREDWKSTLAVEDEQLVDWQATEETQTTDEYGRKR
jgi:hypothetical protein